MESPQPTLTGNMKRKFDRVFQFKVQLRDIRPPIWRRIQVPETYSFWDLHCAIQDAMGWLDCHLHEFVIKRPQGGADVHIGLPDPESWRHVKAGWALKLSKYLGTEGQKARYEYDFGDGWEHQITLERIVPRDRDRRYPACIAGRRACPPEDCGGVWGYTQIVTGTSVFQDQYPEFESEAFDPAEVVFDDPEVRRQYAMER